MYRVDWLLSAQNELAQIWLSADSASRRQVSVSAERIDQLLRIDPHERGESRSEGRRIIFVQPLGASYRVDLDSKAVTVLHVWEFRRRRSN